MHKNLQDIPILTIQNLRFTCAENYDVGFTRVMVFLKAQFERRKYLLFIIITSFEIGIKETF